MNPEEEGQAEETLFFHFACRDHELEDGRSYLVVDQGGDIIGIVGLHRYLWGPPQNAWLAWFAVDPGSRRQRLGSFLLQAASQYASQLGFMKLFIETYSTPEFTAARAFYEAQGFVVAGGIASYLPSEGDMVVFFKELPRHV